MVWLMTEKKSIRLITSSPMTLQWLRNIRSEIGRRFRFLEYAEAKYWASFKSPKTNRNIAYLQPQKSQIRLFVRMEPSYDNSLRPTPASGIWAENFPSIFVIRYENMIEKAIELIVSSYEYDIRLHS